MAELHIRNRKMAGVTILGAAIIMPIGILLPWLAFEAAEDPSDYLRGAFGPFLILLSGWMLAQTVTSVTFGEQISVRTVFRTKVHPWDELKKLSFSVETPKIHSLIPIFEYLCLHMIFASGKHYRVRAKKEMAEDLGRLMRDKGSVSLIQPLTGWEDW